MHLRCASAPPRSIKLGGRQFFSRSGPGLSSTEKEFLVTHLRKMLFGFGGSIDLAAILDFVDTGHDLIIAADTNASDLIRQISVECGVDFDEDPSAMVIDHHDSRSIRQLLYFSKGIGHTINSENSLLHLSAYSANPNSKLSSPPSLTGSSISLVSVVQAVNVRHHKVGEADEPAIYRINDDDVIEIYEWHGKSWEPYVADDVQVQFYMMSPYVLKTLSTDKKGNYFTAFKVPDVYGVFQFKVEYHRLGYTKRSSIKSRSIPSNSSPSSNQEPTQEFPTRKISLLYRPLGLGWCDCSKVMAPSASTSKVARSIALRMKAVQMKRCRKTASEPPITSPNRKTYYPKKAAARPIEANKATSPRRSPLKHKATQSSKDVSSRRRMAPPKAVNSKVAVGKES
ncbi:hypothetical protein J5N97_000305 [Dioscorea zingiberensis]|uniref:Dolichyl-diphosphooligosaccharide--protein glycosyltransferase 48 kDa subunit n=1 Tax=Dioscorea zingiberensis TaxID=325984 RepID=A0A9D5H1J2_9LILI|nr:hypothetical protein J5N97_000305 [Dioscorea zingiberensis]